MHHDDSSDEDDKQLVIDDKKRSKRADSPHTDDDELHSDATSSSSSSSNASRKERKRARLAAAGSRHNTNEQSAATTLAGARAPADGGVWLADRLPDTHNFDKIPHDHHVLLLVTGSVAAIKMQPLIEKLYAVHEAAYLSAGGGNDAPRLHVRVVLTECACHFVAEATCQSLYQHRTVYTYRDAHEYGVWSKRGDPVLHVQLSKWADLMLIAPLSANTLAKLASGMCDNLVTCVLRALAVNTKPVYYAPAMNTYMYANPMTLRHLHILNDTLVYRQLPVTSKVLMCGDSGPGAMAEVTDIAAVVVEQLIQLKL